MSGSFYKSPIYLKNNKAKMFNDGPLEYKDGTQIIVHDGNPVGTLTAQKGSVVLDKLNGKIYQNTDGSTSWKQSSIAQFERVNLVASGSPYTVTDVRDKIFSADLTDGSVVLNLPASTTENEGSECFIYIERDGTGNTLTINTNGTDTIRGQTSKVFSVRYDGFHIAAHQYLSSHWDVLGWMIDSRTDEIKYIPGNEGVTSITTLQDLLDYSLSSGEVSGGVITNNGDGTVSVASAEWKLREADSPSADCRVYLVPAANNLAVTDKSTEYLIANYNAGSPIFEVVSDLTLVPCTDRCVKAILHRRGTQINIISLGKYSTDFSSAYAKKQAVTSWLEYGNGLIVSTSALNFTLSSGALYQGTIRLSIPELTSLTDNFTYYYRDGLGDWTTLASQTAINNLNFDNGTGTLATLSNNKYGVHWVYLIVNEPSNLAVVFGQGDYNTLADARAAPVPTVLPEFAQQYSVGKLVAKLIVAKSATTITEILSPFTQVFSSTSPVNHNDLGGLQGGAPGEYYHLTSARHETLSELADGRFSPVADSTNALRITKADEVTDVAYFDTTNGDFWVLNNISALSYTDRTPYPDSVEKAIAAVQSMEALPKEQYNPNNKENQLDHSKLHPYIQSLSGDEPRRDMSASISCINEVVKYLLNEREELSERINCLEQSLEKGEIIRFQGKKKRSLSKKIVSSIFG